jgi:hypothetical protein
LESISQQIPEGKFEQKCFVKVKAQIAKEMFSNQPELAVKYITKLLKSLTAKPHLQE